MSRPTGLVRFLAITLSVLPVVFQASAVRADGAPAGGSAAQAASASTGPKNVSLTEALELLDSGRAKDATLAFRGRSSLLTMRTADGRAYVTTLTYAQSIDAAIAAARKGKVRLSTPPAKPEPVEPVATSSRVGAWIDRWAPLLIMLGILIVLLITVRQVGGSRFKRKMRPVTSSVRFADVAGMDEIRAEVSEIAEVLREPERFRRVGARLPKGIILFGPPGTGKTMLAKAVAGEAGVPFFSAAGSEFVEMYAGLGAKRIRALFAQARKHAPAVVYIDEIDAVGGARSSHGEGAGGGEREQSLDQLLSELDGFETDPDRPVVILASTNRLEALDPALVRSGRFDRKIAVGLPDRLAREEILRVHTRSRPLAADVRLAEVAAFTAGMAGADLSSLCNEAAFEAAREDRVEIASTDFRRALLRLAAGPERRGRPMAETERRVVAYHEMGHAIAGHMLAGCHPPERVTVIPQGQALGVTIALPEEERLLATRGEYLDKIAMLMAGRAAEELVFGESTSGAADDLRRALAMARQLVGEFAMAEATTAASLRATRSDEDVERSARSLVVDGLERSRGLLERHRDLLDAGALRLLEEEALDREEILAILGEPPAGARLVPLAQPRRLRGLDGPGSELGATDQD